MISKHQLIGCLFILLFVVFGIAAIRVPQIKRNLKVLPPDISDQALDSFMHSYTRALNVNCAFCHATYKNNPDSLNFESDEYPLKDQARKMMRLTIQINKD